MKLATENSNSITVAAKLAPEDVACGDFVALLKTTFELPSYMWDVAQGMLPVDELVRLQMIPSDAGVPLKVFAVCLPFVYVKTADGTVKTLDMRREQIVRLDHDCGKEVWDELKPGKKKQHC
ncbi:hypothetical protein NA78x_000820 [Anatilimnocola sp. NA78]|uniref:hypothetical protein n=1 Tax=Anatilimnocola sp. NA78 TaxID=3415683 RepID=UPI003CE544F0